MNKNTVIVGVGNSGTRILGSMVHKLLLRRDPECPYHYEPLYWSGKYGESDIVLNEDAIREHSECPLLPEPDYQWPFLDQLFAEHHGLFKFIRLGSRISLLIDRPVKIIWITRELYSFLGSMQKNFPRCLPNAGWHHRPGKYDDFGRLKALYESYNLQSDDDFRIEVEAAWWHLQNRIVKEFSDRDNILHVRYEDLCADTSTQWERICSFLEVPYIEPPAELYLPKDRCLWLYPSSIHKIDAIAGTLNRELYPERGMPL